MMPVSIQQKGGATKATIPVAVADSTHSGAAAVTSAEIPVAVRPSGSRTHRGVRAEVIPVAVSNRKSRSRNRHRGHSRARAPKAGLKSQKHRVEDIFTRTAIAGIQLEENAVNVIATAGIAAAGIFGAIARSVLTIPPRILERETYRVAAKVAKVPFLGVPAAALTASMKARSPLLAA